MKRLSQSEIKSRLVSLFFDFVDFCELHNLRYFIIGGTLLGAVRHKGFIPWDDDIDVSMPRPDYEKFINLQRKDSVFNIMCPELHNAGYPFLKILDCKTTIKQESIEQSEVSMLWIDVIPFDAWPNEKFKSWIRCYRIRFLHFLLLYSHAKAGYGTTKVRAWLKAPLILICKAIGSKTIAKAMNAYSMKMNYYNSEWIGNLVWATYKMKERVPHYYFDRLVKIEFEGRKVCAPSEWDKYLTTIYGDYMKLPPEDKRNNHSMEVWVNV